MVGFALLFRSPGTACSQFQLWPGMAMDLVMGVVTGQQMALEMDREQGIVYKLSPIWMLI